MSVLDLLVWAMFGTGALVWALCLLYGLSSLGFLVVGRVVKECGLWRDFVGIASRYYGTRAAKKAEGRE